MSILFIHTFHQWCPITTSCFLGTHIIFITRPVFRLIKRYYRGEESGWSNSGDRWLATGIGIRKFVSSRDNFKTEGGVISKPVIGIRHPSNGADQSNDCFLQITLSGAHASNACGTHQHSHKHLIQNRELLHEYELWK